MPRLAAMALFLAFLMAAPAAAYIGPGLGAGAVGVVAGVVGAIGLALFAIIYYPIKRMFRRRREDRKAPQSGAE